MNPHRHKSTTERVTEIYVAVFSVPVNEHRFSEVILAGYQKDPIMPQVMQIRATVETHSDAVKNLVELCDEIMDEQTEINAYRLLKFDKDGIHILNPNDFRTFDQQYTNVKWGVC